MTQTSEDGDDQEMELEDLLSEFCPGGVDIADSDRVDCSNLVDDMLLY